MIAAVTQSDRAELGTVLTSAQITAVDFCHRRLTVGCPYRIVRSGDNIAPHQFIYLPCSFKLSDRRLSIALRLVAQATTLSIHYFRAVELHLRRYESYEYVGRHERAKEGVFPASGQPAQCVASGHCFNCCSTSAITTHDCQCANAAAGRATSGSESKQSCFHHCESVIRLLLCCFPVWL